MPELLLELGCEELPAGFVRRAFADLESAVCKGLSDHGLSFGEVESMGSPRRLIVSIADVPDRQPDQVKESRGPSIEASFDAAGTPLPPALGFCKGQGIEAGNLEKRDGYVWARKEVSGRATKEILAELLPAAIKGLNFDKGMRWGSHRMRFARPIRWILCSFGGEVVPFSVEATEAGLSSRGHRFNHPGEFEARSLRELMDGLLQRDVEPDPKERVARIREGVAVACTGEPDINESLVEENAFLTEWPSAVEGTFRPEFLALPEPVLVTVMAKHERFFPVRSAGKVTNKFISIRNGGDALTVREGNAWVLNARLNDAQFFFDEDRKLTLDDFLEKTSGILFQEKLGTVRERANRLAVLAVAVSRLTGADELETGLARDAGLYAKADLSCGLVGELPELQGQIGAEYALRAGKPEAICFALRHQYNFGAELHAENVDERTGIRLMLADQIDKLAGFLGVGLAPTGSSDPFGLRRAATAVIECCNAWQVPGLRPLQLFRTALDLYDTSNIPVDREGAVALLADLFLSRYESMLSTYRHDIRLAAYLPENAESALDPRGVWMRARCLERCLDSVEFVQTATRPINIVEAARKKGVGFAHTEPLQSLNDTRLESAEATNLLAATKSIDEPLRSAQAAEDDAAIVDLLKSLAPPINAFFDSTMVMVEEAEVRFARLTLLHAVCQQLLVAGDFTKLVIEG